MDKVFSNIFSERPLDTKYSIRNFKLRFLIYFLLCLISHIIVQFKNGLGVKFYFFVLGRSIRSFLKKRISLAELSNLIIAPLDSFRYFEFHYADLYTKDVITKNYLDISSPRYFPAYLIQKKKIENVFLLNPDKKDIEFTRALYDKLEIKANISFLNSAIENSSLQPESFDLITSISVLEHIPLDILDKCLKGIYDLIRPNGYLLISVPISSKPFEEFINFNEYGLHDEVNNGYYFGQRFHDQQLIEQYYNRYFGTPIKCSIIGESSKGFFIKNRFEKINRLNYPHWKESIIFNSNYKSFRNISDLPGIGVATFLYKKTV